MTKLHSNTMNDFRIICSFLDSSLSFLSQNPSSLVEVLDATVMLKNTESEKNEMKELSKACLNKIDLLHTKGASLNLLNIDDIAQKRLMLNINSPKSRWQILETKLDIFKDKLENQLSNVNQILERDTKIITSDLKECSTRWGLLKPSKHRHCYDNFSKAYSSEKYSSRQ
mmetsp:Transcript_2715/g.2599  ORF Transcript_2715/g.2599 Transcript_2715/m.2599 type:complete len:170 (-) Transcript_2715:4-513(-)